LNVLSIRRLLRPPRPIINYTTTVIEAAFVQFHKRLENVTTDNYIQINKYINCTSNNAYTYWTLTLIVRKTQSFLFLWKKTPTKLFRTCAWILSPLSLFVHSVSKRSLVSNCYVHTAIRSPLRSGWCQRKNVIGLTDRRDTTLSALKRRIIHNQTDKVFTRVLRASMKDAKLECITFLLHSWCLKYAWLIMAI